jgi:hypothetical protein
MRQLGKFSTIAIGRIMVSSPNQEGSSGGVKEAPMCGGNKRISDRWCDSE